MEEVVDSLHSDSISLVAQQTKTAFENGNYQEAIHTVITKGIDMTVSFAMRILLAVIAYFILRWVVKKLNLLFTKMLEKKNTDPTLSSFLRSLVNIVLNFIVIIVIISILGIETSSFVALFASAGIAIGMALSGSLQNFAGGVMIMFFRPFKVGDFLETQNVTGVVKEIQIFNTIILTTDNKTVIVPNGGLSTGIITNYSKESKRRVDFVFSIAYGEDYDKAKSVLLDLLNRNPLVLKSDDVPAPFIAITKLDESSVNIVVRVWVESKDYWNVYFQMNEDVYKEFTKQGVNIPFPQMDVHIHQTV